MLNSEQRDIVNNARGRAAVIAGAGSGKTHTLIRLISRILIKDKVKPSELFICTFTNKAADELKHRLEKVVKLKPEVLEKMWVGTFHSLGHRYLKEKGHKFTVILDNEITVVLKKVLETSKLYDLVTVGELNILFDMRRTKKLKWESLVEDYYDQDFLIDNNLSFKEVSNELRSLESYYKKLKKKNRLKDFHDLLDDFLKELEKDNSFSKQFKWMMVDEAQDNCLTQYKIMDAMNIGNFLLIGDQKQSIFRFRGATPERFSKYINTKAETKFHLSYNYRSDGFIIDFANHLIKYKKQFHGQELKSTHASKMKPRIFAVGNLEDQNIDICKKIVKLLKKRVEPNEIAILSRSVKNAAIEQLLTFLREAGIDYEMRGGSDILSLGYVQNFLMLVKTFIRPTQISLEASLSLLRGIGTVTAEKCATHVMNNKRNLLSLSQTNVSSKFDEYWKFVNFCKEVYANKKKTKILLSKILDFYTKTYLLNKYKGQAVEKAELIQRVVVNFLEQSESISKGIDALLMNRNEKSDKKKVIISTIHSAKGLEWDYVFIPNFVSGILPMMKEDSNDDEEFCLAYTAITRAKKYLAIYSASSDLKGNDLNASPYLLFLKKHAPDSFIVKQSSGDSYISYSEADLKW